ncbi:MAG TPA: glycosyltransferase family 39 protein [Solirubrobacteraceae bacterium]|nr:glycosyltransferase family 39 protein [Solirubrobacteraceae bacterium]
MSRLRDEGPALAVLGLILVAGLVLRVLHNDHGLPYVYYVDEGSHFTKRAVEVFRDPNPGYFQNPSAYTYLLHLVYRVVSIPKGGGEAVIDGYLGNASWVFEVSRALAAVLCLVGVAAVYYVGRQLWDRRTGLVAAAVLCFAFLPVAFSRLAVTDVGTLAPVALVLLFSVRIAERGGWRWCAAAGAAAGLAIGFKYTAGLVLLVPALAVALPLLARRDRDALRTARLGALALAGGTFATFFVTNPFFFLDLDSALHQLRGQAQLAGNQDKFGQENDTGPLYYLDSLMWGLGYVAAACAAAGAVLLARRDRVRTALLLAFPIALFLYLSVQSRFFGRWLLPVYPALALLAGYAFVRGLDALRARAPAMQWPAIGVGAALLLWQPLAADARSMAVLGNEDTRAIARRWLADHYPRGLRIVIEPAVPERYYWPVRDGRPKKLEQAQFVNELIRDVREDHVEYGRTLRPQALDDYRRRGYCTVMTFDLIRGRAVAGGDRAALAYYDRLERESELVYAVSPYRADADPPGFSFDLSYSYYSPAYERPGPAVQIHRLRDCTQRYGGAPESRG